MAEQAQEMVVDVTPKKKAFMAKPSTHEDRIKRDEQELEELKKQAEGKSTETVTEEKAEEAEEPKNAEEKTFKKRYGDLRRHTQEKEKQFQKQLDDLKEQLGKATKKEMKLPKSDEDIEAWATEYPDVAKIVETIAMKKAREQSKDIEDRLQKIDEMSIEAKKEKAEVELMKIHPDFGDIRDSDDFHDWADEQPKWVQDALYENDNDAKSAARAIDLYKADKGIGKPTKSKNDKSAAKEVNTKKNRSIPDAEGATNKILESDVQKMSADEYEKNADMVMEAIRSGNFIYDLSGSAR
jgi:predicted HicB family RNase H-like nuclease